MDVALKVLLVLLAIAIVVVLVIAILMLVRLLRMISLVRDERMPVQGKVAFWAAVVYTVFPVDLLPDPVYLDDVGVLSLAMAYLTQLAQRHGITGADGVTPPADRRAGPRSRDLSPR